MCNWGIKVAWQGAIADPSRAPLAPLRKGFAFVAGNNGSSNAGYACSAAGDATLGRQDRPNFIGRGWIGLAQDARPSDGAGTISASEIPMRRQGTIVALTCNKSKFRSEVDSENVLPVNRSTLRSEVHMNSLIARCIRLIPSLAPCWYAIPLRLIVGYGFMEHGFAKLARGPELFVGILSALGVFEPQLSAWATILVEIFGGTRGAGRLVYSAGQCADDCRAIGCDRHGTSSQRLQFDQASVRDGRRRSLWTTRVRDRPALPRCARCSRAGRVWTVCVGSLPFSVVDGSQHQSKPAN